MKLGLLLIALGYGYRVYADAAKEKGTLRSLGQWVGAIIMATSLVASAYSVYRCSAWMTEKGACPWMAKGEEHHFTVDVAQPSVKK